jgi:hypothetical protein
VSESFLQILVLFRADLVTHGQTLAIKSNLPYIRAQISYGAIEMTSVETGLSQSDFEKLESITGLKFTDELRGKINKALQQFADDCRAHARSAESGNRRLESEKRHLKKIAEWATKGNRLLEEFKQEHPQAWNRLADDGTPRWRNGLMDLRDGCEQLRARRRRALPDYPIRWKLLRSLERIFRDAGGTSTGVHRGRKQRHGPFPDFVDAALRHLPRSIRPGSLTSEWEKIFSGRKKGDYQLSISNPKLFNITLTRRVKKGGYSRSIAARRGQRAAPRQKGIPSEK